MRASADSETVNVLVFTPTPTHPPTQGNRQRVFDMCRAMQGVGAELTMLHYATEGVSAAAVRQMREAWGDIELVFPSGFVHRRSFVSHFGIDDWFDEKIAAAADNLLRTKQFDVCLVNYGWYSKLFEALPREIVRIVDAHDVFGGRAEYFAEIGLDPEWFHTSVEQETLGLDRADFVLAIQEQEADILRARTRSPVHSVGFLEADGFLPLRKRAPGDRLVVGYIGSGNPFNVASMRVFAEDLKERPELRARIEVRLAGKVCSAFERIPHPFTLVGVVDSVVDFYRSVDVVINPMRGGTGLKIKSQEALSAGKPLVASADAMTGIASAHPGHRHEGNAAVLDRLMLLAERPELLPAEAEMSRATFLAHRRVQTEAFLRFWGDVVDVVKARRRQMVTS
jgi:polysaccharide biosynthesis protein PslH